MKREFKSFYIPPERHYKEHEFLEKLMQFADDWNSIKRKTLAKCAIYFMFSLMFIGFIIWGAKTFNIHIKP